MLFFYNELKEKYKDNYNIQKLVKNGKLFKVEKGLYSDTENVNYLEVINKKYPCAIFTMESAFYYHDLTDVIPLKEFLAVKRDTIKIDDEKIRVNYQIDKLFHVGKSTMKVNGIPISVYDKERMLIELIRNRKSIGFDYYKEIIENYRKDKDNLDIHKIAQYISYFNIENHLYDVIMKEVY